MNLGRYPCPECGVQRQCSLPEQLCRSCANKKRTITLRSSCSWCGNPTKITTRRQKDLYHRSGHSYCSEDCKSKRRSFVNSKTMARTNTKHASNRMKNLNPMSFESVREKVSETLRANQFKPVEQGGNGHEVPYAQELLGKILGWEINYILPTKMGRQSGYPTHYKINIANIEERIAIEVDGSSHKSYKVRKQDEKKTEFLEENGWAVMRFWNEEIIADAQGCAINVLRLIGGDEK